MEVSQTDKANTRSFIVGGYEKHVKEAARDETDTGIPAWGVDGCLNYLSRSQPVL